MTACCESIREMQSLRISVYPFCLLAEKSKHLQEFKGRDISGQGRKSWRQWQRIGVVVFEGFQDEGRDDNLDSMCQKVDLVFYDIY